LPGIALGRPIESLRPVRYWDFNFQEPEHPAREEEYVEELDRLFRQAVNRQLVSDVEIGSYLSGGMDTGSITAIAASQLPLYQNIHLRFRSPLRIWLRTSL